jgi:hypothetical protein
MQQWQVFVKSRLAEANMLTGSSTIAHDHKRLLTPAPHRTTHVSRSLFESVYLLLYAVRHAADYPQTVASGTAQVSSRLDFWALHVYPEACQTMPQVDRDAVIVFLGD